MDPLTNLLPYSLLPALLTLVLGIWIGYRLRLGRDRRREWNDATGPVRRALQKSLEDIEFSPLKPDDIAAAAALIRKPKNARAFTAACNSYNSIYVNSELKYTDLTRSPELLNEELQTVGSLKHMAETALKLIKRR